MDGEEPNDGGIDRLEKSLYSRKKDQIVKRQRRSLKSRDFGVSDSWKAAVTTPSLMTKRKRPVIKIFLVLSLLFFAIAAIFSSYFFFQGADISPSNVAIEVKGPALIGGGEELSLQITVQNNNPVPIETVNLIIEYPNGTRSARNVDEELPRYRESIGTVDPGEVVRKSVNAILFGEENTTQKIDVSIEYRVQGSNAIFFADSTYELALSSSPLSLVIESLNETVSGQEIEFTAITKSNSTNVIQNAMLELEYPFGFDFESADPTPLFANRVWYLGDIEPEGEKRVTFKGVLSGQDGEERVFRFSTGIQSESDNNAIGARFVNTIESVFIERPFISVDLAFNGDTGNEHVVRAGKEVRADITWVNNLSTQVFDGEIEVAISGVSIDKKSISTDSGFYRSLDNKIVWSRNTNSDLGSIAAGEKGTVGFSFSTLGVSSGSTVKNPEVSFDVSIRGKRLSDANVPESVVSSISKQVRVSTDLYISSEVLHFTGPFENTGPMPPKADQETTYTVVLEAINTSNDVKNAQVALSLPAYVEWANQISPASEDVTFSTVGGRIFWNIGDIKAGTGRSLPSRKISFQVKLTPSTSQVGSAPTLINSQTITGTDDFTGTTVSDVGLSLNTRLDDPGISPSSNYAIITE